MTNRSRLSRVQRIVTRLVDDRTAAAMEAHSRAWLVTCPNCGHQRSIWELGGIRYRAAGEPRNRLRCPGCGETGWHKVSKSENFPATTPTSGSLVRPILLLTIVAMLVMAVVIGLLVGLVFLILWLSGVFG